MMTDTTEFLQALNPAQRQAAMHTTGPAMIIAGAGSGKTRVLTYRLAYLLRQHLADPFELLALTFTNKAAKEMRERIGSIVGGQARSIQMGTFHSLFSRILRAEAEHLGYTADFTIYDAEDSQNLIKALIKERKLDDKRYKPRVVQSIISNAKNWLVNPARFEKEHATDEFQELVAQLYKEYNERLFKANAMDFDDLLVNMVVMLDTHPDLLHKYQHRFRFILVDEYQDTNFAQYTILKKLAAVHENLTVVGDDAQSIYSFRGANIQNILNFQKDYPDAKVYKLEQNYRSTGTIVQAANSIIANNKYQLQKNVFTENPVGEPIRILTAASELDEAQRVVDSLREQKMVHGYYNRHFAVLYRTNAQSRAIEDGLRRASIPYRVFGGLSFYKRKEIKDVLAYLRLGLNPHDEEAFKRVVNYPTRGIGDTTLERLLTVARSQGTSLWETAQNAEALGLGRSAAALQLFVTLVQSFQAMAPTEPAHETVTYVARHSGILKELHKENTPESRSRWENVQELINAAREYTENEAVTDKSLKGFLAEIALYTDQDQKEEENPDYVTLMTIHAAKGLEFKSVFVVGLEEDLFPSAMSINSREDMEEERRLFYVAVTRAEERLALTHARSRFRFGSLTHPEPSRFLDEVDEQYVKRSQLPTERPDSPAIPRPEARGTGRIIPTSRIEQIPPRKQAEQAAATIPGDFKASDLEKLAVGQAVVHNRFGSGRVVELDGEGSGRRAIIHFKVGGKKTLILKYAKLMIQD
ncbi:MAG: UvrD-helicase domain-containing protein [Bacteroidetes bacterium]|jgi:DNA helicase-2/ATP-dependent DNA helicase PcrA|nr:UvrD-helicase domain-containing protein [Bacteroidota bacterium]